MEAHNRGSNAQRHTEYKGIISKNQGHILREESNQRSATGVQSSNGGRAETRSKNPEQMSVTLLRMRHVHFPTPSYETPAMIDGLNSRVLKSR